jgi:hypothetical protein
MNKNLLTDLCRREPWQRQQRWCVRGRGCGLFREGRQIAGYSPEQVKNNVTLVYVVYFLVSKTQDVADLIKGNILQVTSLSNLEMSLVVYVVYFLCARPRVWPISW